MRFFAVCCIAVLTIIKAVYAVITAIYKYLYAKPKF